MHAVSNMLGLPLVYTRVTYRFIAAKYLYLWIMGMDGWIFSKYIWWLHGSMWVSILSFWHKHSVVQAYSSSIVSCGGRGSSRPRPIISQVKLLSTWPMFMPILLLKLKSSIGRLGDSALKCQRSMSLFAMAIEGSVTAKFAGAAGRGRWFGCCFAALSTGIGWALLPSGLVDELSCVFSSVSTCSAASRLVGVALGEARGGVRAHSIAPPKPSRSPSWDHFSSEPHRTRKCARVASMCCSSA